MPRASFRKFRYAFLLLKLGGIKLFLFHLKRQIYSRDDFIGLEKNLSTDMVLPPSTVAFFLRLASEKDIEEAMCGTKTESKDSVFGLIQRKWFYESGFRSCYIARIADTNEICHMQWLISLNEETIINRGFKSRLPRLKEGEILIENAYTFEKHRGKGIFTSAICELSEKCRVDGFKRIITYVSRDNIASIQSCTKAGLKQFEEIRELKLLFFTKRNHC